jgi:hypothetical protein
MRDKKGRFIGKIYLTTEQHERKIKNLKKSAKLKKNYLGEKKEHPLYNMWRSFRHTKKGKKIGNCERWNKYINFFEDVLPFYEENKRFNRIDYSKKYSKDNFIFLTEEEIGKRKKTQKLLTYNGETKTLEEWQIILDIPKRGLKIRYYTGLKHNHTAERILFGFRYGKSKEIKDFKELEEKEIRKKASKMISSYNNNDLKKGLKKSNLTIDWFIENIFKKQCIYCGDNNRIGADRIDNNKNHDTNNVVPCCYECNVARNKNFTHEEMFIIGDAIRRVKNNRPF